MILILPGTLERSAGDPGAHGIAELPLWTAIQRAHLLANSLGSQDVTSDALIHISSTARSGSDLTSPSRPWLDSRTKPAVMAVMASRSYRAGGGPARL